MVKTLIKRRSETYKKTNKGYHLVDVVVSTGCFVAREMQNEQGEWENFERGLEISHKAIRLERLKNGAPVLNNHHDGSQGERLDVGDVIGRVEDAWIEDSADGPALIARLRLSYISDKEKIICKKVEAGILKAVSVGAEVHQQKEIESSPEGIKRYVAVDWEPLELSLVAIPADYDSIIRNKPKSKLKNYDQFTNLDMGIKREKKVGKKLKRSGKKVVKAGSKFTPLELIDKLFARLTTEERDMFLDAVERRQEEPMTEEDTDEEPAEEDRQEHEEPVVEEDLESAAMAAAETAVDYIPADVEPEVADDVVEAVMDVLDEDLGEMMEEGAAMEEEMAEDMEEEKPEEEKLSKKLRVKNKVKRHLQNKVYRKIKSPALKRRMNIHVNSSYEKNNSKIVRNMAINSIAARMTNDSKGKFAKGAGEFYGKPTLEICRRLLEQKGVPKARDMSSERIYRMVTGGGKMYERRAAGPIMAYADLAALIENSATKAVTSSYEQFRGEQTFTGFVKRGTVPDFKDQDRVSISDSGALKKVEPGEAHEIDSVDVGKEQFKVETYSKIFQITRQAFMTDDTQELGKIFASGKGAADVESDLVYDQVTGGSYGGAPLYSTGRNTLTGSTPFRSNVNQRAPQYNYDGVIAMQVAFRKRLGPKGSKLNLSLGFVLVPVELYFIAQQAVSSAFTPLSAETINPMAGAFQVVTDPRLSDVSTTSYYGVAKEASSVYPWIELANIQGNTGPTLEPDVDFSTDVMRWKVVHDVGAKVLDFRLGHRCDA